jgi:hypothetical protein
MTSLADTELLRARWRRTLASHALDHVEREDFAQAGLARRLQTVTSQLLLLPADPGTAEVDLSEELSEWLTAQRVVRVEDLAVQLCSTPNIRRTAHALVLTDGYDQTWNSYLGVHRSGALELGLGHAGGWEGRGRDGEAARLVALAPLVARVWALLNVAANFVSSRKPMGPFQLTVGVRSANAQLGMLAEGWAEPNSFENSVGICPDPALLWHLELAELPDSDGARQVAYSIGDRLEDAWGVAQRRYLAHRGDFQGRLDPRRIN